MKLFVSVLLMSLVGGISFAQEQGSTAPARVEAVDSHFWFASNRTFYNCDFVENEAEKILTALGAEDVRVRCHGGIPHDRQVSMDVKFSAVKEAFADEATMTGTVRHVELNFEDSCDLREKMMREFLENFSVYKADKTGSCWDARGDLSYKIDLLGK